MIRRSRYLRVISMSYFSCYFVYRVNLMFYFQPYDSALYPVLFRSVVLVLFSLVVYRKNSGVLFLRVLFRFILSRIISCVISMFNFGELFNVQFPVNFRLFISECVHSLCYLQTYCSTTLRSNTEYSTPKKHHKNIEIKQEITHKKTQ